MTSTKKQKMKISRSIVEAVRSLDPPGRFLEKDQSSSKWFDIGDKKAVEKTSQALRDGAASLRKQLSEDLGDPDFLSAVFDMEVAPPEKKIVPKKEKKTPAKKGHRRIKSNPNTTAVKVKHQLKKQVHKAELHMSPRPTRYLSINTMKPPPPQSPIMSPSSVSPHVLSHHMHPGAAHRRVHSQSSVPVKLPSLSNSPVNFVNASPYRTVPGVPTSNSYDYHDSVEHVRSAGPRFGSPIPHHYTSSIPPAGIPTSPYHGMKPRSPYHPPVSPRWSPRTGYARSGHHSASPHPSPHSYVPSDFYRRPSPTPDRRPPPLSPRDSYPRSQVYLPHGVHANNNHLIVPTLGGEQITSPRNRHHLPMSPRGFSIPRNRGGQRIISTAPKLPVRSCDSGEALLPVDFTPPQNYSVRLEIPSIETSHIESASHVTSALIDAKHIDEKKEEEGDVLKFFCREQEVKGFYASPHNENSSSPAAVADVARSSNEIKDIRRRDSDYPSDEEFNPALDSDIGSPLPFDHEDPASLMELPANILSLPISPCGPNDGGV